MADGVAGSASRRDARALAGKRVFADSGEVDLEFLLSHVERRSFAHVSGQACSGSSRVHSHNGDEQACDLTAKSPATMAMVDDSLDLDYLRKYR